MSDTRPCAATTRAGTPCPVAAMRASSFCYQHDPAMAGDRAESRALGGMRRRRSKLPAERVRLRSVADVTRLVERVAADCLLLDSGVKRCNTLLHCARVALDTIDAGTVSEQIAELQEALAGREGWRS